MYITTDTCIKQTKIYIYECPAENYGANAITTPNNYRKIKSNHHTIDAVA